MLNRQFEPYSWSLKDLIENNFFEVPIFQRPYTWAKDEVKTLLDDIFNAYQCCADSPEDTFFFGSLFLRKQGKGKDGVKDKYEIVDGQQRLATFSMLLISIYSIACSRGFKESDKDIADLKSFLWKYSRSTQRYNKNERLITLSSIDKDIFKYLFDEAYDKPQDILISVECFAPRCKTEENIKQMFEFIYKRIDEEILYDDDELGEILSFLAFLLERTVFIVIQSSIDMAHVFGVFESINSKGKSLDDIDLIKTYIFSVLNESDYDTYLTRWGQLIIKTDDNLTDYLRTYINAYLFFYRQKINLKEFKHISEQLPEKYGVKNEAEALKKLINEMLKQVENYKLLNNSAEAEKKINNQAFTTFYRLFTCIGYEHPRPLIFRAFCDYFNKDDKKTSHPLISKKDIVDIVRSSTMFMFKFLSIKGGDSKDAIKYFKKAADEYYGRGCVNVNSIKKIFSEALKTEGITKEVIKASFVSMDFYSKHDLAYCVLSLIESIDTDKNKLLYSQASMMLSHIKDGTIQIDHMLPRYPDRSNKKLKYYCDNSSGEERLVLKKGHDFPQDIVVNGMGYKEFLDVTLNRIGNIRLFNSQLNGSKGNGITQIPEHKDFTTYKQVVKRCGELADLLITTSDLF